MGNDRWFYQDFEKFLLCLMQALIECLTIFFSILKQLSSVTFSRNQPFQTSFQACKELETLEISNTSRSALKTTTTGQLKVATPHAPLGGASPGVGEKSPQQKRLTSVSGHSSSLTSPTG